jgi:hypothetical protein
MREEDAPADDAQCPSGKRHVFAAGVSIFAFDLHEKLGKSMAGIHAVNVPGWQLQLQKRMNQIFARMEPGLDWWRHNWLFQDYAELLHPYLPW